MLPLLILLLGVSHSTAATAEGDDIIISEFAKLPSGSTSYYTLHYSDAGCSDSTSISGFLPGNSSVLHPAPDNNGTCTESSVCAVLFDPQADSLCSVESSWSGGVGEDSDVYLVWNQSLTDFTQCLPDTWYPGCSAYEYFSLGALTENPDLLANKNSADLEGMKDFIYYVYYEDDECTEPASIWSSIDGEEVTVDIVSNYTQYSCAVRSGCAINPSSPLCKALRDGPDHTASFVSKTELDESTGQQMVYDCDTSNVEVGQEECSVISPRECIASSLIPGCHLRFFSGPTLAQYPRVLIGDMTGLPVAEVESDSVQSPIDAVSSTSQVSPALGFSALLGIFWFVLF